MLLKHYPRLLFIAATFVCGTGLTLAMADDAPSENDLRAALVYNVARFVDWPTFDSNDSTLELCVYAEREMFRAFERLGGRKVKSRVLNILWVDPRSLATAACEILYIDEDMDGRPASLDTLRSLPILTIGESRKFAENAGDMALVRNENRVRFVINREATDVKGLKLSSQLLAVADVVRASQLKEARNQ